MFESVKNFMSDINVRTVILNGYVVLKPRSSMTHNSESYLHIVTTTTHSSNLLKASQLSSLLPEYETRVRIGIFGYRPGGLS